MTQKSSFPHKNINTRNELKEVVEAKGVCEIQGKTGQICIDMQT